MIHNGAALQFLQLALLAGGQLALAPWATASVVYIPQVPALEEIWIFQDPFNPVKMDVNGDGIDDVGLVKDFGIGMEIYASTAIFGRNSLNFDPANGLRETWIRGFLPGQAIGPAGAPEALLGQYWIFNADFEGLTSNTLASGLPDNILTLTGDFLITRRYMGVRLELSPGVYNYGWVDIQNNMAHPWNYRIRGWAYESDPGVPISAGLIPEPGGPLLIGATLCIPILRRRKR